MQEERSYGASGCPTFSVYLRSSWRKILIILLLALVVRIAVVATFPLLGGDESRYLIPAINILDGHGFSLDTEPPYLPSEASTPAYPLLITATYALFGRHKFAVRVVQAFLDTFTCLLVAFVSFNLAPPPLKKLAAMSSLIIYGFFSWFTALWTTYILTETLTIFLTVLTITLSVVAMNEKRKGGWFWFTAGLACGLAILTRPDSMLLMGAVVLFLIFRTVRRRSLWEGALHTFIFCLATGLALTPWILRNYISMGRFQPLANEWGSPQPGYMATGYLMWLRTWIVDEAYFHVVFPPAFTPPVPVYFDPRRLPDKAFDSAEERARVEALIAQYNQRRRFTPQIEEEFRAIGRERIRRAPIRFFIVLPLHRAASMWLTNLNTMRPMRRTLRIIGVLPILIGGILGFALWCRSSSVAWLLLSIISTRTIFLAYHYAPEGRYIVEAYPPMIAACGVTAAAVWFYARRFSVSLGTARWR